MSNIGKQPIIIPENTEVSISSGSIFVKGKLGELSIDYNSRIKLTNSDNLIIVDVPSSNARKINLSVNDELNLYFSKEDTRVYSI